MASAAPFVMQSHSLMCFAAKPGQKTLQELDQYRYVDALEMFGGSNPQREMTLDDVKLLVEWKLYVLESLTNQPSGIDHHLCPT